MLLILLLLGYAVVTQSILPNIRSIELAHIINTRFQCINTVCSPPAIVFASNLRDCQYACLINAQCRTASFHQSINQCELFSGIPGQYGILLEDLDSITVTAID